MPIPWKPSLLSPTIFRRSQDIFIASYIELECNHSLSIIIKWTINSCTLNCSTVVQLNESVVTTSSELFIPAKTLPYGTYQIELTVTMVVYPNLTESTITYIKIIPSNIIVNLVQFGTSMISQGYQQDLIIDPGTYSIDPDMITFNSTVSN